MTLLNKFSDDINGVIHVGAHLGQGLDYNNYNLKNYTI